MRIAGVARMHEFWGRCMDTLNEQISPLEQEESKKLAIQAVQRTLRSYLDDKDGKKIVLDIVAYCRLKDDM